MHSNDPSYPYTVMEKREKTLRELFDAICGVCQPSIVCDVGAFNGDESFRFAKALPRSSIYAFEASHRNYTQFFLTTRSQILLPCIPQCLIAWAQRTFTSSKQIQT
jgi:hypothetical protein